MMLSDAGRASDVMRITEGNWTTMTHCCMRDGVGRLRDFAESCSAVGNRKRCPYLMSQQKHHRCTALLAAPHPHLFAQQSKRVARSATKVVPTPLWNGSRWQNLAWRNRTAGGVYFPPALGWLNTVACWSRENLIGRACPLPTTDVSLFALRAGRWCPGLATPAWSATRPSWPRSRASSMSSANNR